MRVLLAVVLVVVIGLMAVFCTSCKNGATPTHNPKPQEPSY